jgi:AraC family transcriptional regulator
MIPLYETQHLPRERTPLHRHRRAYAALVLEGEYEEASVDGRFACKAGDVVLHPPYHAHADTFGRAGARVLNVELPDGALSLDCYAVVAPEGFDGLRRSSPTEFLKQLTLLLSNHTPRSAKRPGAVWLDTFACSLRNDALEGKRCALSDLAHKAGVSAQHASRAFAAHYGFTPARYRSELRARHAFEQLQTGATPLHVSCCTGFADQSHLTREIKRFSGTTPSRLRSRQS